MRRFLCAFAFSLAALPAFAQTTEQKNVLNHAAQAIVAGALCKSLQTNDTMLAAMVVMHGIDIDREPYKSHLAARLAKHKDDARGMTEAALCYAGVRLYGAEGENVRGLVTAKGR